LPRYTICSNPECSYSGALPEDRGRNPLLNAELCPSCKSALVSYCPACFLSPLAAARFARPPLHPLQSVSESCCEGTIKKVFFIGKAEQLVRCSRYKKVGHWAEKPPARFLDFLPVPSARTEQ
jgi:hypothetical protein